MLSVIPKKFDFPDVGGNNLINMPHWEYQNIMALHIQFVGNYYRFCCAINNHNTVFDGSTHGSMIHPKECHSFLLLCLHNVCGLFVALLLYFLPENWNCTWWCCLGRGTVTNEVKNLMWLAELGRWKSWMITFLCQLAWQYCDCLFDLNHLMMLMATFLTTTWPWR